MELKFLKEEKDELRIEFSEIEHSLLNMIKENLWSQPETDVAGFFLEHPEVGKPLFTLKTKGKDAKKVWNTAIDDLSNEFDGLKKEFKKLK
jgi:DNA-directed RNA polymerase subunit L